MNASQGKRGRGRGAPREPGATKTPSRPAFPPPDVIGRTKGTHPCEWCGEPIDPATTKSGRARFCGPYCRWKHIEANRPPDLSRHPGDREHKLAAAKQRQRTRRCIRCGLSTWSPHSPYCEQHSREAELHRAARLRAAREKPKTPDQIRRARDRERLRKRTRPTPKERGYDAAFQKERKRVAKIVNAGLAVCARCGEPIRVVGRKPEPWDLGHHDVDRSIISGPEHRACNRATMTHAARRRRKSSRGW